MFEEIIKRYYQKKIIGYCYSVSDSLVGWTFKKYLIVKIKNKEKLILYGSYDVETYYEREMEIQSLSLDGYQVKEIFESKKKLLNKKI